METLLDKKQAIHIPWCHVLIPHPTQTCRGLEVNFYTYVKCNSCTYKVVDDKVNNLYILACIALNKCALILLEHLHYTLFIRLIK